MSPSLGRGAALDVCSSPLPQMRLWAAFIGRLKQTLPLLLVHPCDHESGVFNQQAE